MLRENGVSYRELEQTGLMLVVKTMHIDFHIAAQFDDVLVLVTKLIHCHGARVEHHYELFKFDSELTENESAKPASIVTGRSVIACVDRTGKVKRLPEQLQLGILSGTNRS